MHITDVYSEAQTHPQSYRSQDNIVTLMIIEARARDEIKTSIHCRESLVNIIHFLQVVNQYKDLGSIPSHIKADGRSLPVDFPVTFILER